VAKGAFEAGVIEVLAQKEISVNRIVATSSGALNAIAFAAGIRTGRTKEMAAKLVDAWIKGGGWHDSLSVNPWNLLRGKGLSDRRGLLKMLNDLVSPAGGVTPEPADIEVRIIVAALNGVRGEIGKEPATTYEKVFAFSGKDFDTAEKLARIFDVTTAACAFPGLFSPVEVEDVGLCVDGGAVNNAPIRYALSDGVTDRILMPVPFPATLNDPSPKSGLKMANHMIDILINERLFRDLKNAHQVNEDLLRLNQLVTKNIITREQMKHIEAALKIRPVNILQIRPQQSLGENAFSGFFSKRDRVLLVQAGRKAALTALADTDFFKTPIFGDLAT
jgi:predicted acylesterase/phospholipase RssA